MTRASIHSSLASLRRYDYYCQDMKPEVLTLARDLASSHYIGEGKKGHKEDIFNLPFTIWVEEKEKRKIVIKEKSVEERFLELAEEWKGQSAVHSSTTAKAMLPSYQSIIGLGYDVLKYILRDLQSEPNHWFWALKAITREDPVLQEDRGYIDKMSEAWIGWGKKSGIID